VYGLTAVGLHSDADHNHVGGPAGGRLRMS